MTCYEYLSSCKVRRSEKKCGGDGFSSIHRHFLDNEKSRKVPRPHAVYLDIVIPS